MRSTWTDPNREREHTWEQHDERKLHSEFKKKSSNSTFCLRKTHFFLLQLSWHTHHMIRANRESAQIHLNIRSVDTHSFRPAPYPDLITLNRGLQKISDLDTVCFLHCISLFCILKKKNLLTSDNSCMNEIVSEDGVDGDFIRLNTAGVCSGGGGERETWSGGGVLCLEWRVCLPLHVLSSVAELSAPRSASQWFTVLPRHCSEGVCGCVCVSQDQ